MIKGGYYVDGKEFCAPDEAEIEGVAAKIKASTIRNVVVSASFIYI
jgi:hypothetical protein